MCRRRRWSKMREVFLGKRKKKLHLSQLGGSWTCLTSLSNGRRRKTIERTTTTNPMLVGGGRRHEKMKPIRTRTA